MNNYIKGEVIKTLREKKKMTQAEFAEKIGIQITKRKALQMVPLLGGLVGGCFNATFRSTIDTSEVGTL